MRRLTPYLIALVVGVTTLVASAAAEAQVVPKPQPKVFRPARPTFSPYFELTRPRFTSPGGLPQYYTFYQRNLEYQAQIARQTEINKQTQQAVQGLQQNVQDLRTNMQGVQTGVGGSYGTNGRYYGTHGGYFRLPGR